jgi:hypothetical protein
MLMLPGSPAEALNHPCLVAAVQGLNSCCILQRVHFLLQSMPYEEQA